MICYQGSGNEKHHETLLQIYEDMLARRLTPAGAGKDAEPPECAAL